MSPNELSKTSKSVAQPLKNFSTYSFTSVSHSVSVYDTAFSYTIQEMQQRGKCLDVLTIVEKTEVHFELLI